MDINLLDVLSDDQKKQIADGAVRKILKAIDDADMSEIVNEIFDDSFAESIGDVVLEDDDFSKALVDMVKSKLDA